MKRKPKVAEIVGRIEAFLNDVDTELADILDVYNYIFGDLTEDDVDNTV